VNPALRGSAAHVFVSSLVAPQLTDEDEHHLRRFSASATATS
jgi:hypothetical protein